MCKKQKYRSKEGFAITEVVVAALLTMITFAGVMHFISYTLRSNYATRTQGTLISMSHDFFTTMETSGYNAVASGSDVPSDNYARSWVVTEANSAKTVTLTLTHSDPLGKTHRAVFREIFTDPDVSGYIINN